MRRQLKAVGGVLDAPLLKVHQAQLVVGLAATMPELNRARQVTRRLVVLRALALQSAAAQQFCRGGAICGGGGRLRRGGGRPLPRPPAFQNSAEIHGVIAPYYPLTRDGRAAPASCLDPITAF